MCRGCVQQRTAGFDRVYSGKLDPDSGALRRQGRFEVGTDASRLGCETLSTSGIPNNNNNNNNNNDNNDNNNMHDNNNNNNNDNNDNNDDNDNTNIVTTVRVKHLSNATCLTHVFFNSCE